MQLEQCLGHSLEKVSLDVDTGATEALYQVSLLVLLSN